MYRIFITILSFIMPIFALIIPNTTYNSVTNIHNNTIFLSSNSGIYNQSGVVIREVGGRDYIVAYIKKVDKNRAKIIDKDPIDGNPLANIKPTVKVGDRVIFGFLYDKVVILAQNKELYNSIRMQIGVKTINPDYFLAFLKGKEPSSKDYENFAKMVGVGLFIIAKDGIIKLYDPISKSVILKESYNINSTKKQEPFFTNFN